MSDPFAPNPAGRYSTPPLGTVATQTPSTAPITGLFASQPPIAQPSMPSQRAMSMAPPPTRYATDEFGSYAPVTHSTSQSTSGATRVRASQPPSMAMPVSIPTATSGANHTAANHGQRQRNRQSHNPSTTLANASPPKPEYLTDEYVLHPSVWAYKQAHPRRPMVGFGPYVLLQTLGEGEFGKVKLGVHTEFGVEVAIKLIRRGSLEDEMRASKVEREIDVLKTLKHPNIVRMFDVIDTEKYIGIVLDFAGGGELFDHILANRYLKEKDAQKLFAQLISGVDYLHKKHIVHRDLKLENLLLDKHRNIIITDFGFANRFDHEQDDLMATSCGSPCYAAPELVVSEGLYVGSAVDIWSCGVILYAMLSGYLPYDDDPANPDGDNINLLYKYIMTTKLNFPEHMSSSAKSLLQIMLVPDPEQRCRIEHIMNHPWLDSYQDLFARSVEDQEYIFQENMYRKSALAKKELTARQQIQRQAQTSMEGVVRSQSSMPGSSMAAGASDKNRRTREVRHQSALPGATTMPEYLSSAGKRPPAPTRQPLSVPPPMPAIAQTSPVLADAIVMSPPTFPTPPQAAPLSRSAPALETTLPLAREATIPAPAHYTSSTAATTITSTAISTSARPPMSANKNRHTIQVEYDSEASYERMKEILDAKRAAAARASVTAIDLPSTPSRTPSPTKRVLQLQAPTSDIEAESASSDQGHTLEGTAESYSHPSADMLRERSAGAIGGEILVEKPIPSTPSRKGKESSPSAASPSTPRASKTEPEDMMTPRARPSTAASRPTDSPRSSGKRFESMPARPPKSGSAFAAPPSNTDLTTAGLPKPPPAKRERTRKGMSLDKFGLAKLLGAAQASSSVDLSRGPPSAGAAAARLQAANEPAPKAKRTSMSSRTGETENKDSKPRRRTLQLMVNRSNSIRDKKPSAPTPTLTAPLVARDMNPVTPVTAQSSVSAKGVPTPPVIVEANDLQAAERARVPSSTSVASVDRLAQQPSADKQHIASSSAAKKVMDWFRRKTLAKDTLVPFRHGDPRSDSASSFVQVSDSPLRAVRDSIAQNAANSTAMSSTSSVAHTQEDDAETSPTTETALPPRGKEDEGHQSPTAVNMDASARVPLGPATSKTNIVPHASGSASHNNLLSSPRETALPMAPRSKSLVPDATVPIAQPSMPPTMVPSKPVVRNSPPRAQDESKMRVHTGLVDQSALSSKPPKVVMVEVLRVLQEMGLEIKRENEYRLRCTRARKRKSGATTGLGLGSVMSVGSGMGPFNLIGSASASKTDSRGLPLPSTPSGGRLSGGGLKGMLLRRGSSYSSTHPANLVRSDSDILGSPSASSTGIGSPAMAGTPQLTEPLYGEHSVDNGDEVKFVVELCRMRNLPGLYHLTIKRLRGDVWSFKFIYQTVLERCETLTH